jgi:hypothetical protein
MKAEQLQQEEEQLLAKLHEIAQQQGQSVQEYLQKLISRVKTTKTEATAEHDFPLAKFYGALKGEVSIVKDTETEAIEKQQRFEAFKKLRGCIKLPPDADIKEIIREEKMKKYGL